MAQKRLKRPRDPVQLAKLIGDIATGQVADREANNKNPAAVELGRLGGKRGGRARAETLTEDRRREIAQAAARRRWASRKSDE